MKTTLSIIKADIGSIGGHIMPSKKLIKRVIEFVESEGKDLVSDFFVSHTGDDVAILFAHTNGVGYEKLHKLAWEAFLAGTQVAKKQGLYGAGQDLLKDSFSGNVKGMGPAAPNGIRRGRTNPSTCLPRTRRPRANKPTLYLMFATCVQLRLIHFVEHAKGFKFVILDVVHTKATSSSNSTRPKSATTSRPSA